jgi:hypothetical protein
LLLGLFINMYWSPILAKKVKEVVLKSSDSLYTVTFSSAELHILRGTIVIFNIDLKPDTAIYNREKRLHLAPNNLVELHVKRLTLSHVHPFKLYFQHKLEIGEIVLNNPELNISYQLNHTKDTIVKDHRTAWQKISKSLHSIHIGDIELGNVKFKYNDYSGNKLEVSELKELNLSARDLLIDSATQTDKKRLLYCRDIIGELNNYKGKTSSGLYSYAVKSLKLSTYKSQLNVEGFTFQPVKADLFFNKSQSDRFTLNIDSMQLNNFDFLNYHKYRMLTASSFVLRGGSIEVFGNPNKKPDNVTDKVITFPNVLIHTLNTALKLDTIRVHRLNVSYLEYNHKSNQTGTITFNNTSGQFLNVTTKKDELEKNKLCAVKLTTYFMDTGKLNISFIFNLTDKDASFSYKGSLGPMNLQLVNKATMPLAMVKINSGTVKRFDFDIQGNRHVTKGPVKILYNNLQVTLLKPDTSDEWLKRMTIASLFANVFIIKHDNPDDNKTPPRSFNVVYQRPITSPFFKTIWATLLEGIKPDAGLNKKTLAAAISRIHEMAEDKLTRQQKKQKRIERREARRKRREEKKLGEGKAAN